MNIQIFTIEKRQTTIQCPKCLLVKCFLVVCFLAGHRSFAAKLAQINLKNRDKYICGSEQTTKYLWESCPKSKLKHLHNMESNLTKMLQDEDKCKEFQLLLKEMEKRLRNEENQSRTRNAGNRFAR